MPEVVDNRRKWTEHNWEHAGHKWSPGGSARGTEMMWWRSVRPRIHAHLPAQTLLEIAPGYGRWTEYLVKEATHVVGVDLTARCVDVCRGRFGGPGKAEFHVNDGASLPMLSSNSVDFAFSLDSLVHVELPQIRSYLQELARTLVPGGVAFLHHSNLAAYAEAQTGTIPRYIFERHWRAKTVSARGFREASTGAGLHCASQEIINWIGRDGTVDKHKLPGHRIPLTDCFTVCVKPLRSDRPATKVLVNRRFVDEWRDLIQLTRLYTAEYGPGAGGPAAEGAPVTSPAPGSDEPSPARKRKPWLAGGRQRLAGHVFAWREPVSRALVRNRCPDCGSGLAVRAAASECRRCDVAFTLR